MPRTGRVTLPALRDAATHCRGCALYARATQTVFGEGSADARLVMIGEQPGDKEDRVGQPFVGPAGALLDKALAEAGIERRLVYVTNAVKHFYWEPRGKQRLHKQPKPGDVRACRPWLVAELSVIRPNVLVLLGATAAKAVHGRSFSVTASRGALLATELGFEAVATWHPSKILRSPDREARHAAYDELVSDLKLAARSM